jgi:uncharacterized protein (DUF305 family)
MPGMKPSHPSTVIAILLAAAVLAGCSGSSRGAVQTTPSPQPTTSGPALLSGPAKAKADSARYPYTQADIDFMSGMIHHHAQAVVMARWAPTHGASPSVLVLCNRIINAQADEIALMSMWLRDRGQPVPEPSAAGMKMMMNGVEHVMLMPGMLSEEQMQQLDQARGAEFDRLFLTFMIQHHKGAITMVEELFGTYGAGVDQMVFKFASDANIDQTTEITRMEKMLTALILTPH